MNTPQAKTGVEVERLPELPDPTYIYHDSEIEGEDDLFEFAHFGAVDINESDGGSICEDCKRLYTADQMRVYATAALAAKRAEAVRMREALEEYDEKLTAWASAYPLEVFPEPDLKKVHALLQAEGMTLDAVSASNMRHVTKGLSELFQPVRASLSPSQQGEPK